MPAVDSINLYILGGKISLFKNIFTSIFVAIYIDVTPKSYNYYFSI